MLLGQGPSLIPVCLSSFGSYNAQCALHAQELLLRMLRLPIRVARVEVVRSSARTARVHESDAHPVKLALIQEKEPRGSIRRVSV